MQPWRSTLPDEGVAVYCDAHLRYEAATTCCRHGETATLPPVMQDGHLTIESYCVPCLPGLADFMLHAHRKQPIDRQ